MRLYHTGKQEIQKPDIHYGRKNADFGWGFYLTPDREFTYRWARKDAVVNIYELDETGLKIYRFDRNREWFDYIFGNRRGKDIINADVIMGPIANDTIFDTMGIFSSGFLEPDQALALLQIGPAFTQVAIKSQKAADQLCWIGAEQIKRIDAVRQKTEQEEYLKMLSLEMNNIPSVKNPDL